MAMKKRGFGAGRWNGYGGKIQDGETIEQALEREVQEESGLSLKKYRKIGLMKFENVDKHVEVHIYEADDFEGELVETEEMAPKWFPISQIPYPEMWPSDPLWYPYYLKGQKFEGEVVFDENHKVLSSEIQEV